jgi:hypothetical protein
MMTRPCLRALTVLFLLAGAAPAALPPLLPARPFTAGERLTYRIRLGPVTVGMATLEITDTVPVSGRTAYVLRYTARSNALLGGLYPVRDRITSWADTLDFRSHRLRKRIHEGRYRERLDLVLDHERLQATAADSSSFTIPPACHDVFSALLRLRASLLEPASIVTIPVFLGATASTLAVSVGSQDRITVPVGRFTCVALRPQLGGEGPFRHEGPVTVDLDLSSRRLPVRVRVVVPIAGALLVELVAVEHSKLR